MHLVAILTRSPIGYNKAIKETLKRLRLRHLHNLGFYPERPEFIAMLKKVSQLVVWSTVDSESSFLAPLKASEGGLESLSKILILKLNSPKKGFPENLPRVGQINFEDFFKGYVSRMVRR